MQDARIQRAVQQAQRGTQAKAVADIGFCFGKKSRVQRSAGKQMRRRRKKAFFPGGFRAGKIKEQRGQQQKAHEHTQEHNPDNFIAFHTSEPKVDKGIIGAAGKACSTQQQQHKKHNVLEHGTQRSAPARTSIV